MYILFDINKFILYNIITNLINMTIKQCVKERKS